MTTGIRKTLAGYQVWFKIGNQTFHLEEHIEDTKKDSLITAKFFRRMLKKAFKNLKIKHGKESKKSKCSSSYKG